MSIKAKTVAFSVAVLLTGAGGVYAFMPANQEGASDTGETAAPVQAVAAAGVTDPVTTAEEQISQGAVAPGTETTAAPEQSAKDQPATPLSKKLTRQQLTPPPATEEEKLQQAAQQESNF